MKSRWIKWRKGTINPGRALSVERAVCAKRRRGEGGREWKKRVTYGVLALDLDLLERGGRGVGGHGGAGVLEADERGARAQRVGGAEEEGGGGVAKQVRCGHPFPSWVLTPDLAPAGPHLIQASCVIFPFFIFYRDIYSLLVSKNITQHSMELK